MNFILERLTGMHTLTDQVIAMDFLHSVKSGVRNAAMAVTECVSPDIREALTRQLEDMLDLHERTTDYLMEQGLYHPWEPEKQFEIDLQLLDAALKAPDL